MAPPKGHAPYPGCEKGGETGGRPPIYTQDFVDNEAIALLKWMEKKENIFIQTFCYERGYSKQRLPEFREISIRFADAYSKSLDRQEGMLLYGSLTKKYHYNTAALVLAHSYGIIMKTEQKLTGSPLEPLECIFNAASGKTKDLNIKDNDTE
jgi:hypothetical protein